MQSDAVSPCWKDLYTSAILENDKLQLFERIDAAKRAICDRIEDLNEGGSHSERLALNRAWSALCALEQIYFEKLPKCA